MIIDESKWRPLSSEAESDESPELRLIMFLILRTSEHIDLKYLRKWSVCSLFLIMSIQDAGSFGTILVTTET